MELFGIPGLRTVATAGRNVFVCVDPGQYSELYLEIGQKKIEFCESNTNPYDDYPLDTSEIATNYATEPPEKRPGERVFCAVNKSSAWSLPGGETVQLEIARRDAPLNVRFKRPILAAQDAENLCFRAKLAVHRCRADLIVTFRDTATGLDKKHTVAFNDSFIGGTAPELYQDVCISPPSGFTRFETSLSISYHSHTEHQGSDYPPFLFIANARICAKNLRDSPSLIGESKPSSQGRWLMAQAPYDFSPDDQLFTIRSADISHSIVPKKLEMARNFFDEKYYVESNKDLDFESVDPFQHYVECGWRESRNPNPEFNVREYLLRHADVDRSGMDPLIHYSSVGKTENRSLGVFDEILREIWETSETPLPSLTDSVVLARAQDLMLPMEVIDTRRLIVMVIPEHNAMSGGIYSIFSIANQIRKMRHSHGYDLIVMTRPNKPNVTYVRNSAFQNSETVYRFEQLRLFRNVSELQIYIPEYATVEFTRSLSSDMIRYLLCRDHVHINILNQNIRLMPEKEKFRDLRRIANSIGQSVAHHAYSNQDFADRYELPTLLLPAYTDISNYRPVDFDKKEKLIIYSDDTAAYRPAVMERLESLKDYQLVKISGMTFERYMDLATHCKFSVSFGEGFDGYVAQPIYQGGIGFALYNDEFFPDPDFKKYENFFKSETEMVEQIVPTIRRLESDRKAYTSLNKSLRSEWEKLYSIDDYIGRIEKLVNKDYEIFPARSKAEELAL